MPKILEGYSVKDCFNIRKAEARSWWEIFRFLDMDTLVFTEYQMKGFLLLCSSYLGKEIESKIRDCFYLGDNGRYYSRHDTNLQ